MTSIAFSPSSPCLPVSYSSNARILRRPRTVPVPCPSFRKPEHVITSMSAVPAEWKATSDSDWRSFRAHLLATHQTKQAPRHHPYHTGTQMSDHPEIKECEQSKRVDASIWAHRLTQPEVGACLLASPNHEWPESFAHLRRSVIVITDVKQTGVSGLLLNRPTRFTVATHRSVLSRVGPEFVSNRVMLGGDCSTGSLDVLHQFSPQQCPGATEIIPGLSHGGFNSARALVRSGTASPSAFHFFVAYAQWTSDSFQAEMDRGAWDIIACSPSLMVSSSSIMEHKSLWHRLHSFLGS